MTQTAGDLISFALRTSGIVGVGQTAAAEDAQTGLELLRDLVAEWQRKRWLVWSLTDVAKTSTGAATYTVATGGDFNTPRPDRIDSAYARLLPTQGNLTVDYPLALITSREEYNQIPIKGLPTFPGAVFYESAWPVGVAHFWPVPPPGMFELHLTTKAALPAYAALSDNVGVPPEYMAALIYSLAVELTMNYGLDPKPSLVARMRVALNTMRMANLQPQELGMPSGLGGRSKGMGSLMVGQGFGSSAFVLNQTVLK
jgi:hypothetical protein